MLLNYLIFILINIIFLILFSKLSKRVNLIDYPNERKRHKGEVPVIGGLIIFFSIFLITFFIEFDYWTNLIIYSSFVVVFLGSIDDSKQVGVTIRLISQIIAGLLVIGGGLSIIDIGDYYIFPPFSLGFLGILLTLVSVVSLTNAINFMDGIDGLASGLTLVSLISILFYSLLEGNQSNLDILYFLITSVLFFFILNINIVPIKKIFLGDSGSTLLGFLLGYLLIYYTHPDIRNFHPILAAWCIALPIFDLVVVIIRRLYRKLNPFNPDRRHLHHLLLDKNISDRNVLLVVLFCSIILNSIGGLLYFVFGPFPALLGFLCFFFIYMILSFGIIRKL